MKVSVVTVCYNSESTILDTLNSVSAQNYPDIEHVIIDGLSKDTTLEIIRNHSRPVNVLISESDSGIYEAMNKGIGNAAGDVIVFLNADDFFAGPSVIRDVVSLFNESGADAVYGDLVYVQPANTNKIIRKWIAGPYMPGSFGYGWMPPHPTFFAKRRLFDHFGCFDLRLKTAADYELMLRLIHKNNIRLAYLNQILVRMRTGGASNASFRNRVNANKEDKMAWEFNGLPSPMLLRILKPLRKLTQYLLR
jgi:glycosyltransferase involved in cell wall biosynthesis